MSTPTVAPGQAPSQPATGRGRGRPPGTKAKALPEIPMDQFVIREIPEDDRGVVRRKRVERTAQQKAVDAKVLSVFKEWDAGGREKEWTEQPVKEWVIATTYEETAVKMLHKGALLHHKKLVIGDITRSDGKSRIPFTVIARPKKTTTEAATPETAATPE
jgi:hypothetical protein